MPAQVRPIASADVRAVGEFLHTNLNSRVPAEVWARCLEVPWTVDQPNMGFVLADGETVLGAHLAFYSERIIDGSPERFCNLGAWCVLPDHRFQGMKLLRALLAQKNYHFTDLSPSGNVPALNAKLGFEELDTTTWLVPNLPWPPMPGSGSILTDPTAIERSLQGEQLALYKDHAGAAAARHLVLQRDQERCYVVFRKDRRRELALFASLLHVSDPDLLRRMARPLSRHLLLRHGACATLAERRVVKHRPPGSRLLRSPRRKMFRSTRLRPAQIDYLYSELVCLAW